MWISAKTDKLYEKYGNNLSFPTLQEVRQVPELSESPTLSWSLRSPLCS